MQVAANQKISFLRTGKKKNEKKPFLPVFPDPIASALLEISGDQYGGGEVGLGKESQYSSFGLHNFRRRGHDRSGKLIQVEESPLSAVAGVI